MKRVGSVLIALVVTFLGVLGLLLAATRWASAVPAEPQLTFNGKLTTAEFIPITGTCDLRFQLFDAEFDGRPAGDAVEAEGVEVDGGAFVFRTSAANLNQGQQEPRWLALAVRCSGDEEYIPLAPRLKHHTADAVEVDEVQMRLQDLAAQGMLVCGDPADIMTVEQDGSLVVWGTSYRLQGGFRQKLVDK